MRESDTNMSYTDNLDETDELEEGGRGPRFPTVKPNQAGDRVVGLMVDYDDKAPVYKYGITPPVQDVNAKGDPKTKDVLTLLVKDGNCQISLPRNPGEDSNETAPVAPGDVVRSHIQGHNRYDPDRATSWRMAKDKLGRGLRVGDVVTIWFISTTRTGHGGVTLSQDKKIIGFEVRPPTDAEDGLVEQARTARRNLKAGSPPPPAPDVAPVLI